MSRVSIRFLTLATASAMALGGSGTSLAQTAPAPQSSARNIVFVGNSFTYGGDTPPIVKYFHPDLVNDLNGTGYGGVPALFKAFADETGVAFQVSIIAISGAHLNDYGNYPWMNHWSQIDRAWDDVILQEYSTLDGHMNPACGACLYDASAKIANGLVLQNADVQIKLWATWSRADQTYPSGGLYYGQSIYQMATDLQGFYQIADERNPNINGVIPVGLSWNRAMQTGFADLNPYDGVDPGKRDLWGPDNYHASVYGSYLEALMLFAGVTGVDPHQLGDHDWVAAELGISVADSMTLQQIAWEQISGVSVVPEPPEWALLAAGSALLAVRQQRRRA